MSPVRREVIRSDSAGYVIARKNAEGRLEFWGGAEKGWVPGMRNTAVFSSESRAQVRLETLKDTSFLDFMAGARIVPFTKQVEFTWEVYR